MELLLTGGTGFFGRALLRSWSHRALLGLEVPKVTIVTRSPNMFMKNYPEFSDNFWLTLHESNVLDYDSLPRHRLFTHVIHAATESTIGPSIPALQRYDDIVTGTRNILDYAVTNNVKRFLMTSSGGVYGPQPSELQRIPESYLGIPDPLDSASAYSIGKRAAEHLCALYNDHFGIEAVIARCFSFIGKDLPLTAHFAVGNFIHDALHNESIIVTGSAATVRTYMNQADLARWLLSILEKGKAGHAYNVGSDEEITISELANRVRVILSPQKPVIFKPTPHSFQGRSVYVPDIGIAKNELHLDIKVSLDESISEFLE
ncbi:NAD(P)-dependent oxidoreductase [Luminiphilus sp.]|nr:NAD(P)-dependent oxidoreductase [Luminiphilus sp.]